MQREEQARSPTKNEWDSAGLEGLVRNEGLLTEVSEKRKGYGRCGDLSVVGAFHCNRKKSGTVPYPINLNR